MTLKHADRFSEKKTAILDVASDVLNRDGARGLTLNGVATRLKLDASTISYYFKRKDDLIAACLERSVRWLADTARTAASESSYPQRVSAFIASNFDLLARQRREESAPLALLSDLPSLSESARKPLQSELDNAYDVVSQFLPRSDVHHNGIKRAVATNLLLSSAFWIPAWHERFRLKDYGRAKERLIGIFANGLLHDDGQTTIPDLLEGPDDNSPRTQFLQAATHQINKHGYKGARVDRIASELGVSTGSFYHHLKTKDELVVASFERTFDLMEKAFALAANEPNAGRSLKSIALQIGHHQLTAPVPLLQIGSYQALPNPLRQTMLNRTAELTQYVAGLIADGMADRSIKPTDPLIAANTLIAMLHGLTDLKASISAEYRSITLAEFMNALQYGIFHWAENANHRPA